MATAREILDVDFASLWTDADRLRKSALKLSRGSLYRLYVLRGGQVSHETFLNYMRGDSGPRLSDAMEYNVIAVVLNEELEKAGRPERLPYIGLIQDDDGGAKLRGRDSNPQPTGYAPPASLVPLENKRHLRHSIPPGGHEDAA